MSVSGHDGVPSSQQVDQLLASSKLALAIENDRYKHLLDHAPVAEVGDEGVDLQVGRLEGDLVVVPRVRAEPSRALTPCRDEGVEQVARRGL